MLTLKSLRVARYLAKPWPTLPPGASTPLARER